MFLGLNYAITSSENWWSHGKIENQHNRLIFSRIFSCWFFFKYQTEVLQILSRYDAYLCFQGFLVDVDFFFISNRSAPDAPVDNRCTCAHILEIEFRSNQPESLNRSSLNTKIITIYIYTITVLFVRLLVFLVHKLIFKNKKQNIWIIHELIFHFLQFWGGFFKIIELETCIRNRLQIKELL